MRLASTLAAALPAAWSASAAAQGPGGAVTDLSAVMASLAAVVGVILVAAYAARRLPFGFVTRSNGLLKVVAQLPLGPRERLLLVEARGSELLIAVSPAGVFNVAASDAVRRALGEAVTEPEFRLGEPR